MKCTIFYAWQSQLPNATNRSLIKSAIEQAAKAISADVSIEARPEIDHDTAGVPGSPSIADTIRAKIDAAEVVVCDVSIVQGLAATSDRERLTPNANVLVELGYAFKSLGSLERVVLVMNTAYGGPDDLPFDLRGWRITSYVAREGDEDRAETKRALAKKLEETFRAVLTHPVRLPATPVERLARVTKGTKVNLVYTLPGSTQPHDRFQVETAAVDHAANVWRCLLLSGNKPGTAGHIPLSDVEEVWIANETTFVRLAGYMEHTPLEPYRYKSRSRSAQHNLPLALDGERPGIAMKRVEVLSQAWKMLHEADGASMQVIATLKTFRDLSVLSAAEFEEFVADCRLLGSKKDELRQAHVDHRNACYQNAILWVDLAQAERVNVELNNYLVVNGLFMDEDLLPQFREMSSTIREALLAQRIGRESGSSGSLLASSEAIAKIPDQLRKLEAAVQKRLRHTEA